MNYFSVQRIEQAIDHLSNYRSDWVIVPLVFAVNGVNGIEFVNLQGTNQPGTTQFIRKFFSGELLGLPPLRSGNTLRPRFKDVTVRDKDLVAHQNVNLWGSGFSSRGYREMEKTRLVEKRGSSRYRLTAAFGEVFERELDGFHFEELLVWLYAFRGFPDSIKTWENLLRHFRTTEMDGSAMGKDYASRFNVDNNTPWPAEQILTEPESVTALQAVLIPSRKQTLTYDTSVFCTRTHLPIQSLETIEQLLKDKGQLILYGPPGTGKTFIARELALHLTGGVADRVETVQFHPAYGYEDFIIGLKPQITEETGQLRYDAVPGSFLTLVDNAWESSETFVMIVDELNRANVPRVLGELLYLLEYRGTKRSDANQEDSNSLSRVRLAHRNEPFSIPHNVYIIGTMNTADRSIGHVDLALRRRFHFYPVNPSERILESYLKTMGAPATDTAVALFKNVNAKLREIGRFDEDLIGHSFFMRNDLDEVMLRMRYEYSVLPLVMEILHDYPGALDQVFSYDSLVSGRPAALQMEIPVSEAAEASQNDRI